MDRTSNADEVAANLERLADCLDMTRGVGRDLLAYQATRIADRARDEAGPDGDWPANRGNYGERKRAKGLPVGVGLKQDGSARMLSLQEIAGEQEITPSSASMSFGTSTGTGDKGDWFTNGSATGRDESGRFTSSSAASGATNQPPRPFYVITDEDEEGLIEIAGDAVADFLIGG